MMTMTMAMAMTAVMLRIRRALFVEALATRGKTDGRDGGVDRRTGGGGVVGELPDRGKESSPGTGRLLIEKGSGSAVMLLIVV